MGIFIKPDKELVWVGDSKKNLKRFPKKVKQKIGEALHFAQKGYKHPGAKPLKEIGAGVLEIVADFKTDTFRAIYTVKIGEKIYVLHTFQKKAKTGIKTPQKEIELIKKRLKLANELELKR